MKRILPRLLALLFCVAATRTLVSAETSDLAPLKKWVTRQSEVRTVQADFTQTRSFHALRDPLASPGHLWFSAKEGFRWEIGDPPKTVVLKKGDASLVIQPAKKRAEHIDPGGSPLPIMDFPLAKNYEDFDKKFEVQSVTVTGNRCHAELLPRDPQARKFLEAFRLDFDTEDGHLLDFELALRDGSSLRNEFTNVRLNGKIDAHVFDYDLTGYEVTDARR